MLREAVKLCLREALNNDCVFSAATIEHAVQHTAETENRVVLFVIQNGGSVTQAGQYPQDDFSRSRVITVLLRYRLDPSDYREGDAVFDVDALTEEVFTILLARPIIEGVQPLRYVSDAFVQSTDSYLFHAWNFTAEDLVKPNCYAATRQTEEPLPLKQLKINFKIGDSNVC